MDIRREWRRKPPKWHNIMVGDVAHKRAYDLDDLVSDFIERRNDPESPLAKNRDDITDYCRSAQTLKEAIMRACASLRPNGKTHNHQSRVPHDARGRLCDGLLAHAGPVEVADCFETLLEIVEWHRDRIPGIGSVTAYDVAVRIGAYLELEPSLVHLHAGCQQGARALGLKGEVLTRRELPPPLRRLKADEVEDFLCVYREVLGGAR